MRLWLGRIQAFSTISELKTSTHLGNSVLIGVCSGHSWTSVKGSNGSERLMLSSAQFQPSQSLTELEEDMVEKKEERKCLGHGRDRCDDNLDNKTGASKLVEQITASLSIDTECSKGERTTTVIKKLVISLANVVVCL